MYRKGALFFITVIFFSTVVAKTDDGTWYKPFRSINSLHEIGGAGDYLWLLGNNGIARLNTVTFDLMQFSFCSLHVPEMRTWNNYHITVGDSNHAAFYNPDRGPIYLYNDALWEIVERPFAFKQIAVDYRGRIWVADSQQIAGYDGREWRTLPLEIPDSMQISSLVVDDTGTLWFVVRWTGYLTLDRNSRVYCFDGVEIHPIFMDSLNVRVVTKDSRGRIWLIGDKLVSNPTWIAVAYLLGPDRSITVYPLEGYKPYSGTIDADGNIWSLTYAYCNTIYKKNIFSPDTAQKENMLTFKIYVHNDIASCNTGVYLVMPDGLRHYTGNGLEYTFLAADDFLGKSCRNIPADATVLFKKNGSLLSFRDYGRDIVEYNDRECRNLPPMQGNVSVPLETSDGTILAPVNGAIVNGSYVMNGGLYALRDTLWELIHKTEDLRFSRITQDRNGKIWGSTGNTIIHQTDFGWELIDSANSNLPFIDTYGIRNIVAGNNDGKDIWIQLASSIAGTNDGYNWTFFDSTNLGIPFNQILLLKKNRAGGIVVWSGRCTDNVCSRLIRAVYNGTTWNIDSIPAPPSFHSADLLFEDSWGDFWISVNYPGSTPYEYHGPIYRYTNSNWIAYDTSNTPFQFFAIIGEDAKGNMYFRDMCNETVIFERGTQQSITTVRSLPSKPAMTVRTATGGAITVDFIPEKQAPIHLFLYSLDGKLVRTLLSGHTQSGAFHHTFRVKCTPGLYFVRCSAGSYQQVTKVVVQ